MGQRMGLVTDSAEQGGSCVAAPGLGNARENVKQRALAERSGGTRGRAAGRGAGRVAADVGPNPHRRCAWVVGSRAPSQLTGEGWAKSMEKGLYCCGSGCRDVDTAP